MKLPFEEILFPMVMSATDELHLRACVTIQSLPDQAIVAFQRQLHCSLSSLASISLNWEFKLFVAVNNPFASLPFPGAERSVNPIGLQIDDTIGVRDLYDRFVTEMQRGRMQLFLQEFPVLARLISIAIEQWVEQVVEFCSRLDKDFHQIGKQFNQGCDPGEVRCVEFGDSDAHNHGRSVMIVSYENLKIVYKPRDLGIDQAVQSVVAWVNDQIASLQSPHVKQLRSLRTLSILHCGTYGWVEFVEHQSCADDESIEDFYRRFGMLICLIQILHGTDQHMENLIANSDQPVLVDLETMLQPAVRSRDVAYLQSLDRLEWAVFDRSVLRSGLVPSWITGGPDDSFDLSSLSDEESIDAKNRLPHWKNINTDRMELEFTAWTKQPLANLPRLDGKPVSARNYLPSIVDGYSAMYELLMSRRDALLSADGPLQQLHSLKLRCVVRHTRHYATMLRWVLQPKFLRDETDHRAELDRLTQLGSEASPVSEATSYSHVCRAEIEALERLDIPAFYVMSDGTDLIADGAVVATRFFDGSGLDRVRAHVQRMSEDDRIFQVGLIRDAFLAKWRHKKFAFAESRGYKID